MRVILLTNDVAGKGGIGNYFAVLKGRFGIPVDYLITGSRASEKGLLSTIFRFFSDYVSFLKRCRSYDLIHLNTSLRIKSVCRDALFCLLTSFMRKRFLVFIHGWDHELARAIENRFLWIYRGTFFRASAMVVLSKDFVETLQQWGYHKPIYLSTTIVDDRMVQGLAQQKMRVRNGENGHFNILFLARMERAKGIYIVLDTMKHLQSKYANFRLLIAGDGKELESAIKYTHDRQVDQVEFLGFVRDEEKKQCFLRSDLYLFPTFWGEGMPTSLVEAMAFGLPVITRPVGGIADFFADGSMGYLTESRDPKVFAELIEKLFLEPDLRSKMGRYNHQYAVEHFTVSQAVARLEQIYDHVTRHADVSDS